MHPALKGSIRLQRVEVAISQEALEFVLRVGDAHMERTSGYVFSGPLDVHEVVADLCGVVPAENRTILGRVALHLHAECTWEGRKCDVIFIIYDNGLVLNVCLRWQEL